MILTRPARLIGLVRFESVLAGVLMVVPFILRAADSGRTSISDYHDMADPRWFFVPLTAAAMMLITNGLVRHEHHAHNAILGVLLLGLVIFDHDGASSGPHLVSALGFYALALSYTVLMVTHYIAEIRSTEPNLLLAAVVTVALAVPLIAALALDPPLFWVEAFGLWIIAAHFFAHSTWEVRHPKDPTEPADVLEKIWPWLHGRLAWAMHWPKLWWGRLNTKRTDAADELAVDSSEIEREWPTDFDENEAENSAFSDDDDPGQLEAVEPENFDALAVGIISHQLRCRLRHGNRYFINDNSSFRVPHTDQYRVRVALFDQRGRRVYLGPFRDKGTANGYRTLLHTEAVWDDGRITRRALVLWQSVNGGSRWTHWVNCS